jgi:hypothetical protein
MNNTLESPSATKFTGLGDDLFSIIPGIEKAATAPFVNASELSAHEFNEKWVKYNKPCLIKGAVKNWPAVQKFKDPDYWLTVCGDFDMRVFPHMNHNDWDRQKMDSEQLSFHNAIKRLFSEEDYILSIPSETITNDNRFSELVKELPGFSFLSNTIKPRMYNQRRFFMYRRAATAWHYHNIDETLMCQINGTKRVALLPPDIPQAKKITEYLTNENYLDGRKLEDSLNLEPIITLVNEGDALYIPPYWHHAVVPDDGEVGFTYAHCWKSPWYKFGDFSNYFVRKLYKDGLWPIKLVSIIMPFLAVYTGIMFGLRSMKKK